MTTQIWSSAERGVYRLRHSRKDLEVKYIPVTIDTEKKQRYQVIVEGIITDLAWNLKEAKTKAIKIAERTHKRDEILTYEERQRQKKGAEYLPVMNGHHDEYSEGDELSSQEHGIVETSAVEVFDDFGIDAQERITDAIAPETTAEAYQVDDTAYDPTVTEPASAVKKPALPLILNGTATEDGKAGQVTFSLTGTFSLANMAPTDALTTIRAATELLREHGVVRCRVTVPSTIDL